MQGFDSHWDDKAYNHENRWTNRRQPLGGLGSTTLAASTSLPVNGKKCKQPSQPRLPSGGSSVKSRESTIRLPILSMPGLWVGIGLIVPPSPLQVVLSSCQSCLLPLPTFKESILETYSAAPNKESQPANLEGSQHS